MIRKLLKPITAYCSPATISKGAVVVLRGRAHKIEGISESGVVATQAVGLNTGYIGTLNKNKTEITFDKEHDWEPKAAV
jgi:hypothetical protein